MDTLNLRQKFTVLVLALCVAASVLAVGRNEEPKNVILIGWDGAQRAHVNECLSRGELPNLQRLASEGSMVDIAVNEVTDTKAGWAQILTGYSAKTSGVYSSANYRPIPKGYTIFERLKKFFGWDEIVTLAIVAKKADLGYFAPYGRAPGDPYCYSIDGTNVFVNDLRTNENVGARVIKELEKYRGKRFFLFAHFSKADTNGHNFGEDTNEYTDALMSDDMWLGTIVQKLKDVKIYEKTLIYVTADHGFDEGKRTHHDAPYVFLATNDSIPLVPGTRSDITPTILKRYGMDLSKIRPLLDGKPLMK